MECVSVTSVDLVPIDRVRPFQFAQWKAGVREGYQYPMVATCEHGSHRIWNVNAKGGVAVAVAHPRVEGSLVLSMGFLGSFADESRYATWQRWVRAMFVPSAIDHRMMCAGRASGSMGLISTVGTFAFDGAVYGVESHPGEIRVTDDAGCDVAVMSLRPGSVLGPACPGGASAPGELLDLLRERAIEVLSAAAAGGRGPWAPSSLAPGPIR